MSRVKPGGEIMFTLGTCQFLKEAVTKLNKTTLLKTNQYAKKIVSVTNGYMTIPYVAMLNKKACLLLLLLLLLLLVSRECSR